MTETKIKIAPHSKESEMMVLGCMLNSIDGLNIASDALDVSDFYFEEHQAIFQTLKTARKKNNPTDIHIISEDLKQQDKLTAVGGLAYLTTLSQYVGTSALIEEYVDRIHKKALLRKMIHAAQIVEKTALEDPLDVTSALNEAQELFSQIHKAAAISIPIIPIRERIESHKETLKKYRGKKYLGLCVKTISEFNEKMLGLRKLILLAAAPNVGKTALTIQLAKEVLLTEPDACLVYLSLEMDAEEIFTRMNLYHSGLNFDTYVLGSQQIEDENERKIFFKEDELRKINDAEKTIEEFGNRLQIIDASTCPNINANIVIEYIERLKEKTRCSRAIVIVDYLQVWPISQRFSSDIEADKWRIGEIKKIRDALNKVNQDPVIVISEARKPPQKEEEWGADLSDVMGTARGTYTPDAVLLLSQLQPAKLKKLWDKMEIPEIAYKDDGNEYEDPKDAFNIKGFLAHHGIALCNLKMVKGRDGMKKFNILLAFHFHKNKFTSIDWNYIMGLAMEEKNKDLSNRSSNQNNLNKTEQSKKPKGHKY